MQSCLLFPSLNLLGQGKEIVGIRGLSLTLLKSNSCHAQPVDILRNGSSSESHYPCQSWAENDFQSLAHSSDNNKWKIAKLSFTLDARNEVWGNSAGTAHRWENRGGMASPLPALRQWQHGGNSSFSRQLFFIKLVVVRWAFCMKQSLLMKRQTTSVLKCHKSHVGRAQSNSSLRAKLGLRDCT